MKPTRGIAKQRDARADVGAQRPRLLARDQLHRVARVMQRARPRARLLPVEDDDQPAARREHLEDLARRVVAARSRTLHARGDVQTDCNRKTDLLHL